jgi:hypothetical protein
MKKLPTLLAFALIIILPSCKKKDYSEFEQWSGDFSSLTSLRPPEPVCFIWVKPLNIYDTNLLWPYKRFCESEELREIERGLAGPEKWEPNQNLQGEKLLAFFMDRDLKVKLKAICFRLDDETKEFIGPKGRDIVLYKLFTKKQPSGNYYDPDPNNIKLAEEQQQVFGKILKLYRENGDPNKIRQLQEELWKQQEPHLMLYIKKYPWRDIDINEFRRKNEEGWKALELGVKQQKLDQKIMKLYQERGDPNEISRLKEEWFKVKVEELSLVNSISKHPQGVDINEIRKFKEDWWQHIEENVDRSQENADQNQPATN